MLSEERPSARVPSRDRTRVRARHPSPLQLQDKDLSGVRPRQRTMTSPVTSPVPVLLKNRQLLRTLLSATVSCARGPCGFDPNLPCKAKDSRSIRRTEQGRPPTRPSWRIWLAARYPLLARHPLGTLHSLARNMAPPARPAPPPALVEALRTARIPLESFDEACATCDSCEDPDAADYPKGCAGCSS